MQSSNNYNYKIGDVTFGISGPVFSESEDLRLFASADCSKKNPDFFFSVQFVSDPKDPDGRIVFDETFRKFYRSESGDSKSLFCEDGNTILLTDIPAKNNFSSICCREISFRESYADRLGSNLILKIMDIPRRIIDFDGIFLHASYVDINGEAILFTGPKQIGKSTHAGLWEKYRDAEIINGDRALLRKKDGVWQAFGSPYCGTSDICKNRTLPIKAIVIIDGQTQVPVQRAGVRRALAAMLDGCSFDTWNKEQMEKVTEICSQLAEEVPFYVLKRVANESSVIALEEVL